MVEIHSLKYSDNNTNQNSFFDILNFKHQRKYFCHYLSDMLNCLMLVLLPEFLRVMKTKDHIGNKLSLVQVIAWHQAGDKPLLDPLLKKLYDAIWWHLATVSSYFTSLVATIHQHWQFHGTKNTTKNLCDSAINSNTDNFSLSIKWTHCGLMALYGGSILAQAMAWCLMAPSHHLNQLWFLITEVCDIHQRAISQQLCEASILYDDFENPTFRIITTSPRGNELS